MRDGRRWMVGAILALSILTGCGQTAQEPVTATKKVEKKEPVAMQKVEQTTPSGMKVESKITKYKVITGVNIRADSDKDSEWTGSLFTGDIVQGTGVAENGWVEVLFEGKKGYVTPGCLEETQEASSEVTLTPTPEATLTSTPEETLAPASGVTVHVTDWGKFTSSKWKSEGAVSCYVQIHSVAGNEVVFNFRVEEGALDGEGESAAVNNCHGKIENGIMNFTFTDDQGNAGVGRMEIADEKHEHLSITTMVNQPNPEAVFKAEIMTELDEIEE